MTEDEKNLSNNVVKAKNQVIKAQHNIDMYFKSRITAFTQRYSVYFIGAMGTYFWGIDDPIKIRYTCGELENLDGKHFDEDDNVDDYGNDLLTQIHNDFLSICKEAEDMETECGYAKMFMLQCGNIYNSIRYTKGVEVEIIFNSYNEA